MKFKRMVSIAIMVALVLTCMPLVNGQAYAAAKKPAAPVITFAKEISEIEDDYKMIEVKWKKVKGAQRYQVAIRSAEKKWMKEKVVKKSKANKKKYTKKNKYKVVAKGKKYIVYKYQYEYSIKGETKKGSFRLIDSTSYGRWASVEINPNSTYTIAVRSVKGNKYSAWKTATVKTGQGCYEETLLTTPGASFTTKIGDTSLTITVGKQVTLPAFNSSKAPLESKGITFIPSVIDRYAFFYNDGSNSEYISVRGKTADGLDAYYGIDIEKGIVDRVSYGKEHPTFNANDSKYSFSTNAGYGPNGYRGRTTVKVHDPNVSVVWTLDGTEPKKGQANKTIDASEYPFGQVKVKFAPYSGNVQVRGTATQESPSYIWPELTTLFSRCEWRRVYNGNTIVMEDFMCNGY